MYSIKKLKLNRPELIERRGDLIKKIQPLIWEYEKTENEELRRLLLQELIEFTLEASIVFQNAIVFVRFEFLKRNRRSL